MPANQGFGYCRRPGMSIDENRGTIRGGAGKALSSLGIPRRAYRARAAELQLLKLRVGTGKRPVSLECFSGSCPA